MREVGKRNFFLRIKSFPANRGTIVLFNMPCHNTRKTVAGQLDIHYLLLNGLLS
jgi:hypothetical protein